MFGNALLKALWLVCAGQKCMERYATRVSEKLLKKYKNSTSIGMAIVG